jgi:hypothetical protein
MVIISLVFRISKNLGFLLSHVASKACADSQSRDLSLGMYLAMEIDASNTVYLALGVIRVVLLCYMSHILETLIVGC